MLNEVENQSNTSILWSWEVDKTFISKITNVTNCEEYLHLDKVLDWTQMELHYKTIKRVEVEEGFEKQVGVGEMFF